MTASEPEQRRLPLETGWASYTDEGQGPPIVAVHGLPGSGRHFRWLIPALSGRARLVRIDLPGSGDTPAEVEPDLSPEGRARFLNTIVRSLALDRPLLMGHSMGGVVASAAIERDPKLYAGLALVSSPGLRPHALWRRLPVRTLSRILARRWIGAALMPIVRTSFVRGGFIGYPDVELRRALHCVAAVSLDEHAARIRRLSHPTLVAWCDDDPLIEPDIARELAAACPSGPRLHFERGGHNPQKTHAVELADAIGAWLPELRGSKA